ncbi:MAG: acyltransferase family protein [Niabella sp.]
MKERYYSLDVFRGITVAFMILVNNPGSSHTYEQLEHTYWNGWTLTDLVFPFFLFAVGNALSFVMPRLQAAGQAVFLKKVFKRFALIFLIGLFMFWFPFVYWSGNSLQWIPWHDVRIMGVLQRIAIAYLLASLIIYYFKNRGALIISVLILLVYGFICYYYDAGNNPYAFGVAFDTSIIGESHMYKERGVLFEPEGFASSLTPVVQVILGYFVGWHIQRLGKKSLLVVQLLFAGAALVALAYFANIYTPINKRIWTSSYVLLTTGLATILLSILIYFFEIKNVKGWGSKFFDAFGKNPLFIYVLSAVIPRLMWLIKIPTHIESGVQQYTNPLSWFYDHICVQAFSKEQNASLMYAIIYVLLLWLIAWWMDKRKVYIKV